MWSLKYEEGGRPRHHFSWPCGPRFALKMRWGPGARARAYPTRDRPLEILSFECFYQQAISRVDSRPKLERYLKRFCRRLICCEYFLSLKPVPTPCPDQCQADGKQGNGVHHFITSVDPCTIHESAAMSTCRVCGCNPAYLVCILIVRAFFSIRKFYFARHFLTNGATRLTPSGGVLLTLDSRRKFQARSEDKTNETKRSHSNCVFTEYLSTSECEYIKLTGYRTTTTKPKKFRAKRGIKIKRNCFSILTLYSSISWDLRTKSYSSSEK